MTAHEKDMMILISKAAEFLADVVQTRIPETGVFQTVSVIFDYPGEPFGGRLAVEKSYEALDSRRITAGIHRKNDDRLVSNYLFTGTKAEVLDWLRSAENLPGLIDTFEHLKDRAEQFD